MNADTASGNCRRLRRQFLPWVDECNPIVPPSNSTGAALIFPATAHDALHPAAHTRGHLIMALVSPASRTQRRVVRGVRILLAWAFGTAGIAKLAGVPRMVQVFDAIGFGQWFRYLITGSVEVVGAVRLPLPAAGFVSASLLTATVLAVVATHPFLSAAA
jgi:hypothetical protein